MAKVLIIDDDVLIGRTLTKVVRGMGHEAVAVETLARGRAEATVNAYDVVFLDVILPDGNGLEALPSIKAAPSSPEVIIMTASGEPQAAAWAINSGAWDYIQKPASVNELALPLVRALEYREEKSRPGPRLALKREGIVGHSESLNARLDQVAQAAATDITTLITGETGTGKELFAWAIHKNSARANRSFVVLDCTALPGSLVESLLFGHQRGAFTGADQSKAGLIKQADGGTLFLDEVGELPLSIQRTFLRVLQERRFRPVGGDHELTSNFRLVAATNQDIKAMVGQGRFREDMFFRLSTLVIDLPALRDRREDIREIALHYISKFSGRYGMEAKGLSPGFLEALTAYDWPGNIRELLNVLERALTLSRGEPILHRKHLPAHLRINLAQAALVRSEPSPGKEGPSRDRFRPLPKLRAYRQAEIARLEKEYIEELINQTQGDIQEACRMSGLSRSRLYALMQHHGIPTPVRTRQPH
ncbi:MAG: sigma-54 dependent transcriptional regulator [Proteobacteria bacterium]|nr:sigma-54 dependent transcriptional regulator [Pseudomonadota bacterium]